MDSLLRAAAECFNQKGYSGTSLRDVARRLNLTDAALYYYVKNKEALVFLCYMRAADIGVNVHYIPVHTQPYHVAHGPSTAQLPGADRYYARALSLPMFR